MNQEREFTVYKGLQKPLVFKAFKGKFIYWAAGGILGSFFFCVISSLLFGYGVGGLVLVAGAVGTLAFIKQKEKNGLNAKVSTKGIIYLQPNFKFKRLEKK